MSQLLTALPPPEQRESLHVSSVTLLLLVLVPCVLLLLLLHCLLLGYKLLLCTRSGRNEKRARCDSDSLCARQRIARFSDEPSALGATRKTDYVSLSEPMLSWSGCGRRCGSAAVWAGPDGATYPRSGSLHVPSNLLGANSSRGWRRSAPVLLQSSDSENEKVNVAPPNSPAQVLASNRKGSQPAMRRSSTVELELVTLDKIHLEGELVSSIPQETSCFVPSTSSSAAGPGLDSDFGASAGVSLRILSADSDGFPGATWTSGLEWDYYDPSYVTQNRIPKHNHVPPIATKQYWV